MVLVIDDDDDDVKIRVIKAELLAEEFELLFQERCRQLKVDPRMLRPDQSPALFLAAAAAAACGLPN